MEIAQLRVQERTTAPRIGAVRSSRQIGSGVDSRGGAICRKPKQELLNCADTLTALAAVTTDPLAEIGPKRDHPGSDRPSAP